MSIYETLITGHVQKGNDDTALGQSVAWISDNICLKLCILYGCLCFF